MGRSDSKSVKPLESAASEERMQVVIVGHVDHGKSTLIGRLLADTGSLPEGKLEQVKRMCERNARPFEYAFLLDALKDERAQGITIDTARSFFKSDKRYYIILDAPGHIEFLKNMVTGAARAEAAMLVIDAKEGVQDNSRRHGFLMSFLGVRQLIVLVNKMDLVDYDEAVFEKVKREYQAFLKEVNVEEAAFIPIAAREGDNLITASAKMPWYKGLSVLQWMDRFEAAKPKSDRPFRLPVQDIYKFTETGDERRIIAGTVETGTVHVGDSVTFYPSMKQADIASVEGFNVPRQLSASAGAATGVTLTTQLYLKPGEIMCRTEDSVLPKVGYTFRATVFWLGKYPLVKEKKYKLKLGTTQVAVYLKDIVSIMDASSLQKGDHFEEVNRHDVAECIFQTRKPVAMDLGIEFDVTSRFVIVDTYEISGGGVISEVVTGGQSRLEAQVEERNQKWVESAVSAESRARLSGQKPAFILITGREKVGKVPLAQRLEQYLIESKYSAYFLSIQNLLSGIGAQNPLFDGPEEQARRLGEIAHFFADAGMIVISAVSNLDEDDVYALRVLARPFGFYVIDFESEAWVESDLVLRRDMDAEVQLEMVLTMLRNAQVIR